MIIPIFIDTSSISDNYNQIDSKAIDTICDNVAKTLAARYAQKLEQEANNTLHQTRKRYIQNIIVVDSGRLEGTVILDFSKDPLIRMIEEGASPFDMKPGLLNGPRAKVGKNGNRFVTVPFRIATPDAAADSDVFSGNMPDAVYEIVKGKQADIPTTGGGNRSAGLQVKELPVQYQKPAKRAEIQDSAGKVLFKEYEHKSSIFAGLIKFNDEVTGQNSYGTFRRVSDKSDPDAWIHPGIERYNLVQKALQNFDQEGELTNALNNEFEKLGLM